MKEFAEVARTLKGLMNPGHGYALLMKLADGQFHYASIANRSDVRETLTEWLARAGIVNARDQGETHDHVHKRIGLEERCAKIGHILESEGHTLMLFLFDFGEKGSLAWYSNASDPRGVVKTFLDIVGDYDLLA